MLVEILHTVRHSIRSHVLVTEPFLVVGLIASIRRMVVISLEMATLTKEASWSNQGESIFLRTSPWRRSILALSYSESGSKASMGPPLSNGVGSMPGRISSGGLWPAFVYSKDRDWGQSLP